MLSTRILTRRRLGAAGGQHVPARRRRRTRGFAQVASTAAADRLQLNAFGHAYLAVGVVVACILCYLVLAAQVTQASYEITRLQDQQRQLIAEQDQLRYKEVTLQAPAQVEQQAAKSGMQRSAPSAYVPAQAVAIDLQAADGASAGDKTPLWERAVTAFISGVGGTRDVMAAGR